ncbi:MAG: DUF523 domain-containing protein [Bacilli bacterium]|nr:DUF523 domain-containing protein [Bacilli bacterium]
MEKILISACLVGDKCKYNGKSNYNPLIKELLEYYELVPFCPEVEGGLSTPRDPSEMKEGSVYSSKGKDVTHNFETGAELAYNICLYLGITTAILKDCSPSCGSTEIYDGSFKGRKIKGMGMTARYLSEKGVKIIPDTKIQEFLDKAKEK